MEVLGEAFDCAANRVNLGLDQFFEMFVATGIADAFGAGAPRYVSGSSGIELVLDVCYRAGLMSACLWPIWRPTGKAPTIGAAGFWLTGSGKQGALSEPSGA